MKKVNKIVAFGGSLGLALLSRHLYRVWRAGQVNTDKVATWDTFIYFKPQEFDSPDQPGSGVNMNFDTVRMLDKMRRITGLPMRVNSGFRTRQHNQKIGGSSTSSHMRGFAADIHCDSLQVLQTFYRAGRAVGFTRIGSYETKKGNYFIHLDNDPDKIPAEWFYKNYSGGAGSKVSKFF